MLQLAWPWLLILLPLPWLAQHWFKPIKASASSALKVPFFATVENFSHHTSHLPKTHPKLQRYGIYFMWALLVFAAARPEWLGPPLALPQSGRDILFAVDLSGSMQTPDMELKGVQVDRLAVVKNLGAEFIKQREGDRLGLILFGSKAYIQTPLTFDRKTVQAMLDDSSIGLAGNETAIGDAIGLAIKHLRNTPQQNRVLVLLTDGANNAGSVSPLGAAQMAAEQHVRIYTIGIGADALNVDGLFGINSIKLPTDLDAATLESIAKITGGTFFRAKDTSALQRVYQTLDILEPVASGQRLLRPIKPLYPWPLSLALLMSVSLVVAWKRYLFKLPRLSLTKPIDS